MTEVNARMNQIYGPAISPTDTSTALNKVHEARDLSCPLCSKPFKFPSEIALHMIKSGKCHVTHVDSRYPITKSRCHPFARVIPTVSISYRMPSPTGTVSGTITSYTAI
ncbi:hypothetical protein PILCRDRAFT_331612 [Piloderma croceum F 1598]|uniref:C2H2-type domain-containing protein n=1 Tax=Piloderma croceum (strain F 1598) TaxID=765440 RepID=A0A0C3BI88_PILCF|nr:hypothetical protein PILCRDRAFT_331612 [Piloderma croceum F 1598]